MNLKALFTFLIIFILGIGAGFLISGRLTKKSIEAVKERETPMGFKNDLYKYLKPDENQRQIIDSIVSEYIPRIKEERAISQLYQKHLRDSMYEQIQQLLDVKQKGKLKKFEEEKITKKPPPIITKQKDTVKSKALISRQERMEAFKESLTPEQKKELDTIISSRKHQSRNPAMNQELRQYAKVNVMPLLREYRSEFEKELNEDEKRIIEDLRQKRKDLIKSELMGLESEESAEKQKSIAEAKNALKDILLNHKAYLEKMTVELKPQREKWEADMDAIKAKYIPDYKARQGNLQKKKEKNAIDFILLDSERKAGGRFKGKR